MKFLIDDRVAYAEEVFSTIGKADLVPARDITRATVQSADALIVRSVTKVNSSLLRGSGVKFVGTATVGEDHIRLSDLRERNIGFASAAGCSSAAVAEFVVNALCRFQRGKGGVSDKTLGIIGAGRIGSELKKRAELLGARCLLNDPPLREATKSARFLPLEEVVGNSDIISIHVPLTFSGKRPTFHFINESVLSKLNSNAVVVNTSRGEVMDEKALLNFRDRFQGLILDVWENEPDISPRLLEVVDIATPHVAGYSWRAKIRATEMIYRSACEFFNISPVWTSENLMKSLSDSEIILDNEGSLDDADFFQKIFGLVYDIRQDDAELRNIVKNSNPGGRFRELRDGYRFRDEFQGVKIKSGGELSPARKSILLKLGFNVESFRPLSF